MYSLKRSFLNFGLSLALAGSLTYGGTVLAATEDEHKHGCFFSFDGDGTHAFYFIGGKHLGVLIEDGDGLKVSKVLKGSAAEKAGIKAGDVITAIGGQPVSTISEVRKKLKEVEFGKPFDVSVQRDGASVQLSATLEKNEFRWNGWERPLEKVRADRKKALEAYVNSSRGRLGISTQELTEQLRDYFGVEKATGVLVASVGENTPAARAGIKAGDIITAINGAKISDTGDIRNELRKIESGDCTLTVVRKGKTMQLKATLEPKESFELHEMPMLMPEILLPKIEPSIRIGSKALI